MPTVGRSGQDLLQDVVMLNMEKGIFLSALQGERFTRIGEGIIKKDAGPVPGQGIADRSFPEFPDNGCGFFIAASFFLKIPMGIIVRETRNFVKICSIRSESIIIPP